MSIKELSHKVRKMNVDIEVHGIRFVVGGDFTKKDNVFNRGAAHFVGGNPVIVPVCLGSGYFASKQIERNIHALASAGNDVKIFIASGPARHNLMAAKNLREKDAVQSANSQAKNLLGRINRPIAQLSADAAKKFSYFTDEGLYQNPIWLDRREEFGDLYKGNAEFKKAVNALTEEVLKRRYDLQEVTPEAVSQAKNYSLEELAVVAASPEIIGTESVCFTYHRNWDIFTNWADGVYDGEVRKQFGFLACHALQGVNKRSSPTVLDLKEIKKLSLSTAGCADQPPSLPFSRKRQVPVYVYGDSCAA